VGHRRGCRANWETKPWREFLQPTAEPGSASRSLKRHLIGRGAPGRPAPRPHQLNSASNCQLGWGASAPVGWRLAGAGTAGWIGAPGFNRVCRSSGACSSDWRCLTRRRRRSGATDRRRFLGLAAASGAGWREAAAGKSRPCVVLGPAQRLEGWAGFLLGPVCSA